MFFGPRAGDVFTELLFGLMECRLEGFLEFYDGVAVVGVGAPAFFASLSFDAYQFFDAAGKLCDRFRAREELSNERGKALTTRRFVRQRACFTKILAEDFFGVSVQSLRHWADYM